jgi:hypothetical protein
MNLQHWIEKHSAELVAIIPLYFLFLWLLVGAIISYIGGWFSLSKVYRTRVPFDGAKWGGHSGRMRGGPANYNNVLTVGATQRDLYLAGIFLFGSCTLHSLFRGAKSRCEGATAGFSST